VIKSRERQYDRITSVDLAPWPGTPPSDPSAMFTATVHCEYRVTPASRVMRFSCVSDQAAYEKLLRDPESAVVWKFRPSGKLQADDKDAFALTQFTIDGTSLPIRHVKQTRSQSYMVSLPDDTATEPGPADTASTQKVTIAYTYQALLRSRGHLFYLDVGVLTKGLKVAFRYGGCCIRDISPLNSIASSAPPRLTQTPWSPPTPSVEISFDNWVLPRAGVAFVWTLDQEAELQPSSTPQVVASRP